MFKISFRFSLSFSAFESNVGSKLTTMCFRIAFLQMILKYISAWLVGRCETTLCDFRLTVSLDICK